MTKGQIIEQVYLLVSGGRLSPDTHVHRADIENLLPAAINYAITTYNRQERRDNMEDIGILGVNSAMSQAFTITKTYTPTLDTERDKYKITLDVKVQNLPKNKGIDDVFPVQGKSYIRASSQREVQGLCGLFWWPEFPDVYLSDIGFPVCDFKVRLVQSVTELGENDEVPLPGDMEFQLIELLGQFFFKQRGEDKKVNANDDRTE